MPAAPRESCDEGALYGRLPALSNMARRGSILIHSVGRLGVSGLAVAAFLIVCVSVGRLHWFFWKHAGPIGFDDGYTMALGERLIDGKWLPYVDGCSHRGPLLYWAAAFSQLVTGRFGWKGARVLSIATTYGSLIGVFAWGFAAARPLAGALAAVFLAWAGFGVLTASPTLAITGEGVAAPLVVFGFLAATAGLAPATPGNQRHRWLAGSGVFFALAGLAKQTALPVIVPITLWVFADSWARSRTTGVTPWRAVVPPLRTLLGGFAGVCVSVVLLYAVAGELRTFVYWFYTYNADVYMSPFGGKRAAAAIASFISEQPWAIGAFVFMSALSLSRAFVAMQGSVGGVLRGYAAHGLECTAALVAVVLFVSAVAALRFWPHYFLCVLPFVGIVLGIRGTTLLGLNDGRVQGVVAAFALLALPTALMIYGCDSRVAEFRREARSGSWRPLTHEPICDVIDKYSKPGESLFVWGFNADINLTCRRRPATRFTYLTLVAGTVPPDWSVVRDDLAARGSRELLFQDLEKERPPVILDAHNPQWPVSFTTIGVVRRYIEPRYCRIGEMATAHAGTTGIWVRRDRTVCS